MAYSGMIIVFCRYLHTLVNFLYLLKVPFPHVLKNCFIFTLCRFACIPTTFCLTWWTTPCGWWNVRMPQAAATLPCFSQSASPSGLCWNSLTAMMVFAVWWTWGGSSVASLCEEWGPAWWGCPSAALKRGSFWLEGVFVIFVDKVFFSPSFTTFSSS